VEDNGGVGEDEVGAGVVAIVLEVSDGLTEGVGELIMGGADATVDDVKVDEGGLIIVAVGNGIVEDSAVSTIFVGGVVEAGVRRELLEGSLDPQERTKIIIIANITITIRITAIVLPLRFILYFPAKASNKHRILCQNTYEHRIFAEIRKL
jgi:hypothetical protein